MEPEETWKYANSAFNNSNHTVLDAHLFRFNLNLINNVFFFAFNASHFTHLWPCSKSKFNPKSDRVNLVAPAIPIECLLYLPNVRAIQYKLGPESLIRLGNSNVQRLPVIYTFTWLFIPISHFEQGGVWENFFLAGSFLPLDWKLD